MQTGELDSSGSAFTSRWRDVTTGMCTRTAQPGRQSVGRGTFPALPRAPTAVLLVHLNAARPGASRLRELGAVGAPRLTRLTALRVFFVCDPRPRGGRRARRVGKQMRDCCR